MCSDFRSLKFTIRPHTESRHFAPEIQLFYKAKDPRAKDERDFADALPVLGSAQQDWLAAARVATYGEHAWLRRLDCA